jgi:hypothetical protein
MSQRNAELPPGHRAVFSEFASAVWRRLMRGKMGFFDPADRKAYEPYTTGDFLLMLFSIDTPGGPKHFLAPYGPYRELLIRDKLADYSNYGSRAGGHAIVSLTPPQYEGVKKQSFTLPPLPLHTLRFGYETEPTGTQEPFSNFGLFCKVQHDDTTCEGWVFAQDGVDHSLYIVTNDEEAGCKVIHVQSTESLLFDGMTVRQSSLSFAMHPSSEDGGRNLFEATCFMPPIALKAMDKMEEALKMVIENNGIVQGRAFNMLDFDDAFSLGVRRSSSEEASLGWVGKKDTSVFFVPLDEDPEKQMHAMMAGKLEVTIAHQMDATSKYYQLQRRQDVTLEIAKTGQKPPLRFITKNGGPQEVRVLLLVKQSEAERINRILNEQSFPKQIVAPQRVDTLTSELGAGIQGMFDEMSPAEKRQFSRYLALERRNDVEGSTRTNLERFESALAKFRSKTGDDQGGAAAGGGASAPSESMAAGAAESGKRKQPEKSGKSAQPSKMKRADMKCVTQKVQNDIGSMIFCSGKGLDPAFQAGLVEYLPNENSIRLNMDGMTYDRFVCKALPDFFPIVDGTAHVNDAKIDELWRDEHIRFKAGVQPNGGLQYTGRMCMACQRDNIKASEFNDFGGRPSHEFVLHLHGSNTNTAQDCLNMFFADKAEALAAGNVLTAQAVEQGLTGAGGPPS